MGTKKDAYFTRLAKARKLGDYASIPKELLQAALAEEQAELEAEEDAYYEKLGDIIEESPIWHPHALGCAVVHEDGSE